MWLDIARNLRKITWHDKYGVRFTTPKILQNDNLSVLLQKKEQFFKKGGNDIIRLALPNNVLLIHYFSPYAMEKI